MSELHIQANEFRGRRALVTGGSKGIGAAIARRLVAGGANVVITSRAQQKDAPSGAHFVAGDLRSSEGTAAIVEHTLGVLGGLDILINNAGAGEPRLPDSSAISDDEWMDALQINFLAAVRLTKGFLPSLKESSSGAIVNLSASTTTPAPGPALHYLAAKAALQTYTIGLGRELAPAHIRVNLVTPGPVVSPGGDGFRKVLTDAMGLPDGAFAQQVPLGNLGRPEDVAEMVAYLVSDRGRWLTMHNYYVDGGMAAL